MPAEFQKAIYLTYTSYENIFTYLCDILIVTKINDENLPISFNSKKCKLACDQVNWLGYHVNSQGIEPLH